MSFELKLRTNIVEAAAALNRSGASFAVFAKSRCNTNYWIRTENGGFRLRQGVPPAIGIRDIYANGFLYAFECATAMVIVLYKAVLDSIDEQKFNTLFANIYLHSWQYDQDLGLTTININRESRPGDILYFRNPDFPPETPEWQGLNVVKMGNNLYFGHDFGITNAGEIIFKLNRYRKRHSTRSAYLLEQATYPNFNYLSRFATGRSTSDPMPYSTPRVHHNAITAKIGYLTYVRL